MTQVRERALGSNEAGRLAALLPVAVLQTDPQGACLEINPAGCQVLDASAEQAVGPGWLEDIAEGPREDLLGRLGKSASDGSPFSTELLLNRGDGSSRTLSCHVVPLMDQSPQVTGHLMVLQDITERQETERTLRLTARELEEPGPGSP